MAWVGNGEYLMVATGSVDGGVIDVLEFQAASNDHNLRHVETISAHTSNCFCLKINAQQTRMAVGSADFLVSLWDLNEFCCYKTLTCFE